MKRNRTNTQRSGTPPYVKYQKTPRKYLGVPLNKINEGVPPTPSAIAAFELRCGIRRNRFGHVIVPDWIIKAHPECFRKPKKRSAYK